MSSKSQSYNLLTTIFAFTALILMFTGTFRCNMIKFIDTFGTSETISLQLGIWDYQFWSLVVSTDGSFIFESCHSYPGSVTMDAAWKTAKAFSIITFILAISVLVIQCITLCTINPERVSTHGWDSPLYLLTALCQGMTLIILSSNACHSDILSGLGEAGIGNVLFEESCRISTGARLVISATSFWAAAGCTSFVAHKAEKEEIAEEEGMGLREPLTA